MSSELDPGHIDPSPVLELLERQRADDLHDCAQIYVSLGGEVLLDTAVGESRPGRPLAVDDVMLWYSAGKPLTTVAILQLWEQGRLGLDDRVGEFVAGWGDGKERCTLRHVLTHTGGFPMYGSPDFDTDLPAAEVLARIAATPAAWEPGTKAGYHPVTGWHVLGAVIEAVDGRPVDTYLRDEILAPLGATSSSLGVPVDAQVALGERLVPVAWKGHRFPVVEDDGGLRMVPYRIDELHNLPWHVAKVEPGASMRGPARDLGRFYEALLGCGPKLLEPGTVELMSAVHRHDLRDAVFGFAAPWGLGVTVDLSGGAGRRAYGHGGMASSRGFADPECALVAVVVCNGLPNPIAAEQRLVDLTDALYTALGDGARSADRLTATPLRPPPATLVAAGSAPSPDLTI